jgi:hypothetical protein
MHAGVWIELLMQVILIRRGFWTANNKSERLKAAWLSFRTWCQTWKKKKPRLHEFSHVLSQCFASCRFHMHVVVCLMLLKRSKVKTSSL